MQADRSVELRLSLARHQRSQELHDSRRYLGIHHVVSARKAEDVGDLVLPPEQSIYVKPALLIVQDRNDEGNLVGSVDGLAYDVHTLVAVEGMAQDHELEIFRPVPGHGEEGADGVKEIAHVSTTFSKGQAKPEGRQDLVDDPSKTVPGRIVAPEAGDFGLQVLRGHHRPHEDEAVVVVDAVEQMAEDRVVEGLRELRLAVLGQETEVLDLDPPPQGLVERLDAELGAQSGDGLADTLIVVADTLSGCPLHRLPVRVLEALPRTCRRHPKQPVVPIEAGEDGLGDLLCPSPRHRNLSTYRPSTSIKRTGDRSQNRAMVSSVARATLRRPKCRLRHNRCSRQVETRLRRS